MPVLRLFLHRSMLAAAGLALAAGDAAGGVDWRAYGRTPDEQRFWL